MRSELFVAGNLERQADQPFVLQNTRMLRAAVTGGRDVIAQKGAMVAYQGAITFAHEGSSGMKQMLKKAMSSDNMPLMRVSGTGEVFFATGGANVHIVVLEGDAITVNGPNLLAFESALTYDLQRVKGAGMMTGGVWNTHLSGTGLAALITDGEPVILDCSTQPTFTDIEATVAWSASLTPTVKSSMNLKASLHGGSGEAFQYAFSGPGFVIVQPAEMRLATS